MQISPIQQTQYQTANPSFQGLGGGSFVEKVKIANYALKMKKQGYQLLKNPKGTPNTVVSVLKYDRTYTPQTLDVLESYEQITKDFSKPNDKIKTILNINHYTTLVDNAKKFIARTKTKEFYKFGGEEEKLLSYKSKGQRPDRNRKAIVDGLNEEIYDKDVCKVSLKFRPHYPDSLRLLPECNIKTIKESLYTLESEKIIKESTENKSNNSFWKNLFSNLFK